MSFNQFVVHRPIIQNALSARRPNAANIRIESVNFRLVNGNPELNSQMFIGLGDFSHIPFKIDNGVLIEPAAFIGKPYGQGEVPQSYKGSSPLSFKAFITSS